MRRASLLVIATILAMLVVSSPIASPPRAIMPTLPEPIHNLYVNAGFGDDKNLCTTLDHPCQTIQGALDRIPAVLSNEVIVNVAAGTYTAEAVLMDRSSPRGYPVRILGEKGVTFLDGLDTLNTGIRVFRAPSIFLEGLSVTGFRHSALSFDHTAPVEVSNTRIFSNRGIGMEIHDTTVVVVDSIVDESGSHGIVCDVGFLELRAQEGGKGVVISRNSGNGVRAIGCHVMFEGPAVVTLNQSGLMAEHGAEINLMSRTDVIVSGNTTASGGIITPPDDPRLRPVPLSHLPLCELVADNHGVMTGYGNVPLTGTCACLGSHFGVCDP